MSTQRKIILVNGSRLLRGILKRVIERDASLHVIAEIDDIIKVPTVIEHVDTDWIILAIPPQKPIPKIIDQLLRERPELNCLIVATDGSQVRLRRIEAHETPLNKENLEELLAVLREMGGKDKLAEAN